MNIPRIDHVGIIVNDLPAVKAFFLDLGFEVQGEGEVEGEWVDRVVALDNVKGAFAMMRMPGGESTIELVQFLSPAAEGDMHPHPANTLGIRHIAIAVDDIDAALARLREHGAEPFNEVQQYEDMYKLCYVRGPEGIIIELAEQIG